MEYEEFIEVVGQASGGLSAEMAERATQATLQALAERLPRDRVCRTADALTLIR